jgi:hypothetical protein
MLSEDGGPSSTVDVGGSGFALLVSDGEADWRGAAVDVERSLGVPIAVHPMDPETAGWRGAALVRPDGVLAWRGESGTSAGLEHVLGGVLALESEEASRPV